jgi:hypothetical protein
MLRTLLRIDSREGICVRVNVEPWLCNWTRAAEGTVPRLSCLEAVSGFTSTTGQLLVKYHLEALEHVLRMRWSGKSYAKRRKCELITVSPHCNPPHVLSYDFRLNLNESLKMAWTATVSVWGVPNVGRIQLSHGTALVALIRRGRA